MSMPGTSQQTTQNVDQQRGVNPTLQPYLSDVLGQAQGLYQSGTGGQIYQGPTVAPLDPTMQLGLNLTSQTAGNLNQSGGAAQPYNAALSNISSGGITPQIQGQLNALSGISGGTSQADQYLSQMATPSTTVNPYLRSQLDAQNALISNRINSAISGAGRYGSAGQADVLGRSLAGADAPVLAQAFENQQNRGLQAAQALNQAQTGAAGTSLGAQQGAANTALGWAGLTPSLNQLQYDPANRLLGIGGLQTDRAQQELSNQIAMQNQTLQLPWQQLAKYAGAVGGVLPGFAGTGTTTGTTTGSTENQVPWWSLLSGGSNSPIAGAANVGSAVSGALPGIGTALSGLGSSIGAGLSGIGSGITSMLPALGLL